MRAQRQAVIEFFTGGALVLVLAGFIVFVFSGVRFGDDGQYDLIARFTRIDGLGIGSEVRAAGVPVGTVSAVSLDENNQAVTVLRVKKFVQVDTDASAVIATDGLFGAKFVRLDIGGGDDMIQPGGEIVFTQEAMIVEDLLQLIVNRGRARFAAEPVPDPQ